MRLGLSQGGWEAGPVLPVDRPGSAKLTETDTAGVIIVHYRDQPVSPRIAGLPQREQELSAVTG